MPHVTLSQVLDARERRAALQKRLIAAYGTSLISFTMNIAGPVKTSPLIERAFFVGVALLKEQFADAVVYEETATEITGPEAMLCVRGDAAYIKSVTTEIEERHPLGRLFDMDVIGEHGEKLNRSAERGCLVCGKAGRACAAGRAHTADELWAVTTDKLTAYFASEAASQTAQLVYESLLEEVYTTPKAGLVDRRNQGSHTDMDVALFERSAAALKPYFERCFQIGRETRTLPTEEAFARLRSAGVDAEQCMLEATGGVNTHKGAVFSFGVLCGAIGREWSYEHDLSVDEVLTTCAALAKTVLDDLRADVSTAGGRAYREHRVTGIRGEAASGFLSVAQIALPMFRRARERGLSRERAGAVALVHLIAQVDDTTLYHRGGAEGAAFAKDAAKALLARDEFPSSEDITRLDDAFIERRLSPGGCADLLAVTYFLSKSE